MTEEELRRLRTEARQEYLAMNYPTLRDSFAMAVLSSGRLTHVDNECHIARRSYEIADAMLAERAKGDN